MKSNIFYFGSATLAEEIDPRLEALGASRFAGLEAYRLNLGHRPFAAPHFDPNSAGSDAEVLILLQNPGPSAAAVRFASLDNPTGTARNLRRFLEAAKIDRSAVTLWNTVPWVLAPPGSRNQPPSRADIVAGLARLPELIAAFDDLKSVVLMGRVAQMARGPIERIKPRLKILECPHPSPTFVNTSPGVAPAIIAALCAAGSA
ncbi:uracil-DNA glycosylase [Caulobacter sp. FWC2]|uniref:uracil-DNA glycosylase n=1 Tax=Caulobacter sp. FWC2 TaxID=69664 RepID=UPI000C15F121|nr:uracil-DNA glycosylase [Caulobacter sp. FWC2]PIB92832.1 uracil-DNA glycosylase [Caulobacter sp. FWC2]